MSWPELVAHQECRYWQDAGVEAWEVAECYGLQLAGDQWTWDALFYALVASQKRDAEFGIEPAAPTAQLLLFPQARQAGSG
jgi:hypothetical protein|tara:strand:+ start:410 stop:652 length:243 start_codon:yes stop_codon:yes gene_type:complete